jgi:type IV secretion system protein VirB1
MFDNRVKKAVCYMTWHKPNLIIFALCFGVCATQAAAEPVSFADLAKSCASHVDIRTLAAVVRQESAFDPYAIGVNGGDRLPRQPVTQAEAVATAGWLEVHGYDFDMGLGQINVRNVQPLGLDLPSLFDPCYNLSAASEILTDCYDRAVRQYTAGQPALLAALSCYNTGDFTAGVQNGYVQRVATGSVLPVPALLPIGGPQTNSPSSTALPSVQMTGPAIAPPPPQQEGDPGLFDQPDVETFNSAKSAPAAPESSSPASK